MLCAHCQRENDPDYRFCIFCGSRLGLPEGQKPQLEQAQEGITNGTERGCPEGVDTIAGNAFYVNEKRGLISNEGFQMIKFIYEAITERIRRRLRK